MEAIRTVQRGGQFISEVLAHKLIADLRRGTDRARHESLSDRELQVCKMSAAGKSVKEIAHELSLSPKTVSTFRSRVFEKLNLKNDVELAHYVRENGLM